MTTASARLGRALELVLPAYEAPARVLLDHPRARALFPGYLTASAYVALVMVPLMEAALARATAIAPSDAVAAGLTGYLEHHIPEEMHGDEPGGDLLEDLAALGVDTGDLREGPLPAPVAALIGTQFFRIRHAHPVSVLGFLWLEAYPPLRSAVERLMEVTGLPPKGFRQLLEHSEVDLRHGRELAALYDALPLSAWQERLVRLSALETMSFMTSAWLDIVDDGDPDDGVRANAAARPRGDEE